MKPPYDPKSDSQQMVDHDLQREIMEQLSDKAELQNSAAQFKALVESSADHIFMLDKNGTYLFSNNRVGQFGLHKGNELVGSRLQDVYSHDICNLYRQKLQQVIRSNKVVTFDHEKRTSQGLEYHLDTLYPIHKDNAIWAVGGICRDISQQKKIEKQLFQAQKMEALGTLVAGIAHEINNPISLILFNLPLLNNMWTDLLPILVAHSAHAPLQKYGGLTFDFIKDNLPRMISDMEMAANRVTRIVAGLKDFSRKSNVYEKSEVHINQAVENATRLAGATLKNCQATLKLELASHLPPLLANMQSLEQIILNLIINAIQSIVHGNGIVSIKTALRKEDGCVAIEVTDNGRGVNPAVAEKIFDPFVTDRQADGGTGLGLSVTYNLIKAHNGDIFFKSKPDGGTTFTVVLPTTAKRKMAKIMVVDDDSGFRSLLIHSLSKKTESVVEGFANGAEALIRLGSFPPDLLILDMFMPQIDGLGVCRAIKNELGLEKMKVIIVTGFPEHPNLYEASRMGFTKIFTKPLAIEKFIEAVRETLHGNPA